MDAKRDSGGTEKPDFGNVTSGKKPDFSNVEAGGSTTAPDKEVPLTGSGRIYTVVEGDSLSRIAKRELGDAGRWREIFEANSDIVKNPDLIFPGQKLRLP
jgi:nucleoid-associated protein YgaU